MTQNDKFTPQTAADQCFDRFLRECLTSMTAEHTAFLVETDTSAFTEDILMNITRAEQELSQKNTEKGGNGIISLMPCSNSKEITQKERTQMKSKKFLVAAIAAVLCLSTSICFATGTIDSFISHSYRAGDTFPTDAKMEQILGCLPDAVAEFSNGFLCTGYAKGASDSLDENNTKLQTLPHLALEYKKGEQSVSLLIEPVFDGVTPSERAVKIAYNDEITLYYSQEHYRFVPPSYEITPEEQAAMDAGELNISYGTEKVEDCRMSNLNWVKNGLSYTLTGQDLSLNQDDLVQMAKEILSGRQ